MPQCISFLSFTGHFIGNVCFVFLLTVTNIHKCKEEARTSLSEKSEKKLSVKVIHPNYRITHPKERIVKCDLLNTSAYLYQTSDQAEEIGDLQ